MMKMNTFETVQRHFFHALHDLQEVQKRGWRVLPMSRTVKEEQLGRCCYLAEEFLSATELDALKHEAKLNEQEWRAYKVRVSGQ
jgi:hypothetical protein